ncbi:SDR family NAD(P)-dependent oxidoreductase [Nocardia sp. NPDC020380]|uniref:SDR family NAD(P)-dependent oxidoreductase n=1 Tax=Nocardia sp. NPDC020380 TaxID=3364309 RepID=UPI0037AE6D35
MTSGGSRVALVTGAGGGIGAAVVRRLAAREFIVAAIDLRASWCDTAWDTAGPRQAGLWTFGADLSFLHEAEAAVTRVAETLGPPTVIVNAPFPGRADLAPDLPDWESLVQARLRAPLLVSRAAERYLTETGGRIITVAQTGLAARRPDDLVVRETLHALTETLSQELAPHGVLVNTVVAELNCANPAPDGAGSRADCCLAVVNETAAMVEFLAVEADDGITGRMIEARHPAPESPPGASTLR